MKLRVCAWLTASVGSFVACGSADRHGYADGDPAAGPDGAAGSIVASNDGGKDGGRNKDGAAGKNDAGDSVDDPDASSGDAGSNEGGAADSGAVDGSAGDGGPSGPSGPVTGGPCVSGAPGATALRVKWINAGGKAQASYEVNGLPDTSRWKTSAYGYQIGFTPSYVDPYLASGGLLLDSSDFVDVELSTVGLSVIRSVTLSIFGRSYATTTSGSFSWQTAEGTGATASGVVSNAAPYVWTRANATAAFAPGDPTALLRVKAGPPSGALVVSKIELCVDAD